MNKLQWLNKLIAFDTTSRESNLDLIYCIRDFLLSQNIESILSFSPNKEKANLFATIPGKQEHGGLILSGHTDVVPVDGQEWNTNPFVATQIGNTIYGRGTCDMKGYIAVVLALVPEMTKLKLSKPLHFAFSYDEEVDCSGVSVLLDDIFLKNIKPAACIVGEPSLVRPVVAHKGINGFKCIVHGKSSHSSLTPNGCNAIDYAAELICKIRTIADELRYMGERSAHYDVPFSTMSTNIINGGIATNTIPESCEFHFELRNLPHLNSEEITKPIYEYINSTLLPKMKKEFSEASISLEQTFKVPGLIESSHDCKITRLARDLTNETEILKVAYATEAGLFSNQNISTIICGPGDILQAHRANEFVTIEQLDKCERFLSQIIQQFCTT